MEVLHVDDGRERATHPGRAGDAGRGHAAPLLVAGGFSEEVRASGAPVRVRILGEDLVLFRDGVGRLGLVGLHCSHRGTSLEYGRVEESGIRCAYHGWLYDVRGNCLQQPAEPEESTLKDRIRHPAYRTQELGGFAFAYLGPEPAPLLPRYDLLLREDGTRVIGAKFDHCNWLQGAENAVDQSHLPFLHASVYPTMAMKQPSVEWERTWYGVKATTRIAGIGTPKYSHFLFPSNNRVTTARAGTNPDHNIRWRVPGGGRQDRQLLAELLPHPRGPNAGWAADRGMARQ